MQILKRSMILECEYLKNVSVSLNSSMKQDGILMQR